MQIFLNSLPQWISENLVTTYVVDKVQPVFPLEFCPCSVMQKLQWSKFEDLIGCIEQFMSQAASHLASREELQRVQKGKGF